jgi:hypothetical protein
VPVVFWTRDRLYGRLKVRGFGLVVTLEAFGVSGCLEPVWVVREQQPLSAFLVGAQSQRKSRQRRGALSHDRTVSLTSAVNPLILLGTSSFTASGWNV